MREFTFIEPQTNMEFMVNFEEKTFKILDCYTYIKDFKEEKFRGYADEELLKLKWVVVKNPLFGHNKKAFKLIAKNCVVLPFDEEEFEFLHNAMAANDISLFEICEP